MAAILLISQDDYVISTVKNRLIPFNYDIILYEGKELLLNIYRYDIKFMIVDIKYLDKNLLKAIKDVKEQEYVPTVGLYSEEYSPNMEQFNVLKYLIAKKDLASLIVNIASNFMEFKLKYDDIKEGYNTIDTINSQTDQIFKSFVSNDTFNRGKAAENLLEYTFTTNKFLANKPSVVIVSSKINGNTLIEIYRVSDGMIKKDEKSIILRDDLSFGLDISIENEFFSNCDDEEYSDIDSYQDVFENEIIERIHNINNFTGYSTTDTAVIGLNYKHRVSNIDAKIIKGLCINLNLMKNIYTKISEVNYSFIYTVNALARAGEAADDDTGNHIKRVNEYSKFIAEHLGMDSKFVDTIHYSAQMHDVGKIHIPNSILKKPSRLTDEEFGLMQQHTVYGAVIIGDSPHLKMAAEIALNHHEKFDGTGYPNRRKGEEIPLAARIVALGDIYDALRSPRVYKPGFTHDETYEIIIKGDGRVMPGHFAPDILNVFKKMHKDIEEIYEGLK